MKRILQVIVLALVAGQAAAAWQALPQQAPAPADNPSSAEKIELGKMLFFDPRLSSSGTVSCFSCHNVMEGGDDQRSVSMGVHGQTGGRNAPTVLNAAFLSSQFWDGRAATLEEQALGPITNPVEMGMESLDAAIERIRKIPGYEPYFEAAFGAGGEITADKVAKAIAAYERTLVTPNSPYDRYVRGDTDALNEQQIRGMQAFQQEGCTSCHSGATFSGPPMPVGTGFFTKFPMFEDHPELEALGLLQDKGRFEVTGGEADTMVWRVPSLRNVELTAPYLHNGAVKSLEQAVTIMARSQLNKTLSEQQVSDIASFLRGLSGELPEQVMPTLPPTPGDLLE